MATPAFPPKTKARDTQLDVLSRAGVDRLFQEKITGVSIQRPALDELLTLLRPGDTVTVARLSRLGHSSSHPLELMADFNAKGVHFVSLDLGLDTGTSTGRLVLAIFAALAEYERERESNRERSLAGIALAKEQGKHLGRRAGVDPEKADQGEKCAGGWLLGA